jgi:hydrogenase-4 transcriptional activator
VLITGESGTGKELVARALHAESARARAIFLPFNCTATSKDLIDSQLFGHRRGAFTGATANYPGIIKAAEGGTLFLDEIGDVALEVQPKLMRFLQEGEIQPLGETKPLRVDVRVLAATNSDLERAVDEGRFREDLFHRLNIIRIHVPPLRDRAEEVPVLAQHFLDHFSVRSGKQGIKFTQDSIDALTEYDWPGNVRQLRNEIERVVAYGSEGLRVRVQDLSPEVTRSRSAPAGRPPLRSYAGNGDGDDGAGARHRSSARNLSGSSHKGQPIVKLKEATAELERKLIGDALARNRHNLSRTASDLGLSRRGLRLKLAQLGIERERPG